jgi:hypothetical protein
MIDILDDYVCDHVQEYIFEDPLEMSLIVGNGTETANSSMRDLIAYLEDVESLDREQLNPLNIVVLEEYEHPLKIH